MIVISRADFDIFINHFKLGEFGTRSLGQAFYDEHDLQDFGYEDYESLYDQDNKQALNTIRSMFVFE